MTERPGDQDERAAVKAERASVKAERAKLAAEKAKRASVKRARGTAKVGFTPMPDDASIEDRLVGLEKRLEALAAGVRELGTTVEQQVRGLRRMLLLDPEALPFPQRLIARRCGIDSQTDEDGITMAILDEIGIGPRLFVEIGCGNNGGNTGFLARGSASPA